MEIRLSIRLSDDISKKFVRLMERVNTDRKNDGQKEITRSELISIAIDYYYGQVFGEDADIRNNKMYEMALDDALDRQFETVKIMLNGLKTDLGTLMKMSDVIYDAAEQFPTPRAVANSLEKDFQLSESVVSILNDERHE